MYSVICPTGNLGVRYNVTGNRSMIHGNATDYIAKHLKYVRTPTNSVDVRKAGKFYGIFERAQFKNQINLNKQGFRKNNCKINNCDKLFLYILPQKLFIWGKFYCNYLWDKI